MGDIKTPQVFCTVAIAELRPQLTSHLLAHATKVTAITKKQIVQHYYSSIANTTV